MAIQMFVCLHMCRDFTRALWPTINALRYVYVCALSLSLSLSLDTAVFHFS